MKKIFHKLSKIMFIAAMVSLVVLVMTTAYSEGDTVEGFWGGVGILCILVILVFAVFAAISVVLGIVEGWKKDKIELLKKFGLNVVWVAIVYGIVWGMDYFNKVEMATELDIGEWVLRVLVIALGIFGGEYMIADHSKDEKDELHF